MPGRPAKKMRLPELSNATRSWHFSGLFAPPFAVPDHAPCTPAAPSPSTCPSTTSSSSFSSVSHNVLSPPPPPTLSPFSSFSPRDSPLLPIALPASNLCSSSQFEWDMVAVTADEPEHAAACAKYLATKLPRSKGHIIAVPNPGGQKVGSGGASLHALVTVAEYLSARAGDSYINPARLKDKAILIFHSGGCDTAAWLPVPLLDPSGHPVANVDLLLSALDRVAASVDSKEHPDGQCETTRRRGGVWVCNATLVIAHQLVSSLAQLDWGLPGITLLAAPCSLAVGAQNGVYRLGTQHPGSSSAWSVHGLTYLSSEEDLRQHYSLPSVDGVAMACGMAYLDHEAASAFLELHTVPPFNSCTVYGVDEGLTPIPFSFLLDLMPDVFTPLPSGVTPPKSFASSRFPQLKRTSLSKTPIQVVLTPPSNDTVEYISLPRFMRSLIHDESPNVLVLNSIVGGQGSIGPRGVCLNAVLEGRWSIGADSVACGIRSFPDLQLGDGLVAQELQQRDNTFVLTVHGKNDNLTARAPGCVFFGDSLEQFLERTGLEASELWQADAPQTFETARLFVPLSSVLVSRYASSLLWFVREQDYSGVALAWWRQQRRVSLQEALAGASLQHEFEWMQEVEFRIDADQVSSALMNRTNTCLLAHYARCASREHRKIFGVLDKIAAEAPTDIAARAMAHIADVLAAFAQGRGGLRSGPARNQEWVSHLNQLAHEEKRPAVVSALRELRQKWMRDAESLIRAARHYEGAAQKLISNSVWSASQFIELEKVEPPPCEAWIRASTPLRIDLAGGWTDTPPLAFEHGGVVTNLAITIDGERPIGARARSLREPILVFVVGETRVVCKELSDLADYGMPSAPAALLKVCVLCLGLLDVQSPITLADQLKLSNQGRGLELHSWSNVPTGSGLGTSSILAACLLAVIAEAIGVRLSRNSLVHCVLKAEQMLTTGGGWQDQVGGIFGGAKIASSKNLPLKVETECLSCPPNFYTTLSSHLVLVYTGTARLARNLLQNVIRRWYARLPEIVETTEQLTNNALCAANAIRQGDLKALGGCLSAYWGQKKHMAEGCEPEVVANIFRALADLLYGCSLAGAGGGGFMVLLTKAPNAHAAVKEHLQNHGLLLEHLTFHTVAVDEVGLVVELEK